MRPVGRGDYFYPPPQSKLVAVHGVGTLVGVNLHYFSADFFRCSRLSFGAFVGTVAVSNTFESSLGSATTRAHFVYFDARVRFLRFGATGSGSLPFTV